MPVLDLTNWFSKKDKLTELQAENEFLREQLASSQTNEKNLEQKYNERIAYYNSETAKQPVEINWKEMRAFSVERIVQKEYPKTIIGYWKEDQTVGEWLVYCNVEGHKKLVDSFAEYNNSKSEE